MPLGGQDSDPYELLGHTDLSVANDFLFELEYMYVLDGEGYGIWEDAHYWLDLYYDDKDYFYEMMEEEGMEEDYFAVNEEFDLDVANETLIEDYDYVCQLYDIDIDDFEL